MPVLTRALIVALVVACSQSLRTQSKTIDATERISLTLSSQAVSQGRYGWCTFMAEVDQDRGGVSHRCGGAGPFGTAPPGPAGGTARQRALTAAERITLRQMYEAAKLLEGGHVGADLSHADLPFEILIVRSSESAVVLVTTGNPSFSNGPRRVLVEWLRNTRATLLKR